MVAFLFSLALSLLATVRADTIKEVDPITIETRALGSLFVEFYKPHDISSQNFAPQFEQVAKKYKSESVSFARINCQDYAHYCQEKGVSEFPTVLSSLHRGAWKAYQKGSLDQFVKDNKPFRNTEGASQPITTVEQLQEITESKEPWFVKFYAPWCGHCKNLAPEWVQVASRLKDKVNVGEVNCDANKALCKDIAGLPTLKYFVHGTSIQYHGERKADTLVEFAMDYSSTAVRGVRRDELFDTLLKKYDVSLIYVTEKSEKKDLERLEAIAPEYIESLPFYTTSDPNTAERLQLTTLPAIVILKDEGQYVYDAKDDLAQWIKTHSQPLVHSILPHNSNAILRQHPATVVLGLFAPDDLDSLATFRQLASRSDVFFAYLDGWAYAHYASRVYGVNTVHLPAVLFLQPQKQQYFRYTKENASLDIGQPEKILEALEEIDQLVPTSTAPSKAISMAGQVFEYIQQYWVLFSGGFFALLLVLTLFIATSEPEKKTNLKKE